MSEIVLQHMVMSSNIIDDTDRLFCKTHTSFPISLSVGEIADFNCHYNVFDIGTYKKYTGCSDYYLRLRIDGEAYVFIQGYGGNEYESTVNVNGESVIPLLTESNMIGICIKAITQCEIISADFCCFYHYRRNVSLSLCICTYKKEQAVVKKVSKIKEYYDVLKNNCPDIVITDNGGTLSNIEGATIVPSNNLGGSGGFARAMMYAVEHDADYIILNDDDAIFEPEVLYRVQTFLSLLNDEDGEIAIGGTMLDIDHVSAVLESGAIIENQEHIPLNKGLDVFDINANVELSKDGKADYNGWWFYVLSRKTIEKNGCPLPLFLKNDDVEYGLRSRPKIVHMVGISVWHPSMTSRYSSSIRYYDIRNLLVMLSIHDEIIVKKIVSDILLEIAAYRYLNAEAMMEGLNDFIKGPTYTFKLCKKGMKLLPEEDIKNLNELEKRFDFQDNTSNNVNYKFRKYTMNGLFLPCVGNAVLSAFCMQTEKYYRIKKILYIIDDEKGFIAERDRIRTIKDIVKVMRLGLSLRRRMKVLKSSYKEALAHYSSKKYWKQMFEDDG